MINIKRLNNLLSDNGYQKFFPLDFEEQLNNKNYDFNFKINEVLKQIDIYGSNPLIYILSLNKDQKLGFKGKDIIDIINIYPKQLLQIDNDGFNPLMLILANNITQKLGLDFNIVNKLYEQQIDKKYEYIDYNNQKQNILFNEEYILKKLKYIHNDLIYIKEFLNYRKALLEKQKITNVLKVNQIINNIVKI